MKRLFFIYLLSLVLLTFTDNLYANTSTDKLIDTLFNGNIEKSLNDENKKQNLEEKEVSNIETIIFADPIELMPNIVDALEEKRLYGLKGNKINIKKVNIFGIIDGEYLKQNKITILSDYSVPSWQIACVLKDPDATSFLEKSKGKSVLTVELIGIIKNYRRSLGMILDPCTFS